MNVGEELTKVDEETMGDRQRGSCMGRSEGRSRAATGSELLQSTGLQAYGVSGDRDDEKGHK